MEVHRLCRLCLTYSHYHCNIFAEKVFEKGLYSVVNNICGLKAHLNDGLPEYICADCLETVSRTLSFINKAQEAEEALKLLTERNRGKLTSETSCLKPSEEEEKAEPGSLNGTTPSTIPEQDPPENAESEEKSKSETPLVEIPAQPEAAQKANKSPGRKGGKENAVRKEKKSSKRHADGVPKNYSCQHCGKVFHREGDLKSHATRAKHFPVLAKKKKPGNQVMCYHCPLWFSRKEHQERHMRSVHKIVFSCEMCGRELNSEWALTKHMEAHLGLRPYICLKCDCRFKDLFALERHTRCIKAKEETAG